VLIASCTLGNATAELMATALRVDRVHLDRRRVTLAVAFVAVHGELVERTPKSHRHREVPVPRFLAVQLGEHIVGRGPRELVFFNPDLDDVADRLDEGDEGVDDGQDDDDDGLGGVVAGGA